MRPLTLFGRSLASDQSAAVLPLSAVWVLLEALMHSNLSRARCANHVPSIRSLGGFFAVE
jgi:hypothetical protein